MADTTNLQLYLYDCPPGRVTAVFEVMERARLCVGWDGPLVDPGAPLRLGAPYTDRFACGDASSELAGALIGAAPEASFLTWTDPAYDWLGVLVRYTPTLGRHDSECNAEGGAQYAPAEILDAVRAGALDALLGTAWDGVLPPEGFTECEVTPDAAPLTPAAGGRLAATRGSCAEPRHGRPTRLPRRAEYPPPRRGPRHRTGPRQRPRRPWRDARGRRA